MSRIPEELEELYDQYNNGDWEDEEEKIWLEETLFSFPRED